MYPKNLEKNWQNADWKRFALNVNFLQCTMKMETNLARNVKNPLSYLCGRRCPWNSGCNCLQRSLFQPRKDWRQNDYNKESVKLGQTWLAATFEKWYTQISVGLDFRVPCQHTGMVPPPKMCKNEHTKVNKRTHAQTHDQLRQALKTR